MKIIDLSTLIYNGMPVYPEDPEVKIKQVHTLSKQGWNLRTLFFSSHLATHVNVPSHMIKNGKTLDEVPLEYFCGPAVTYQVGTKIISSVGLIFSQQNIDKKIAKEIVKYKPKFVGLSEKFEFEIEIEKFLLRHDIISFENLANTDKLPSAKPFIFYGFPLKITGGDGSPVRAVAVIE